MRQVLLALVFAGVTAAMVLALPAGNQTDQITAGLGGAAVTSSDLSTVAPETVNEGELSAPTSGPTQPGVAMLPSPTTAPIDSSSPTVETTTSYHSVSTEGLYDDAILRIELAFDSRVDDVSTDELATYALATLSDARSWGAAGFSFVRNPSSQLTVILAEGSEVDELCLPLRTAGQVSCQNGPVVALNATRWRESTETWDADLEAYRRYLVNHEVGHLIGQRHPQPRCPVKGSPAAVMEQQTRGLEGCVGNSWPRPWELDYAILRPAKVAPLPSWAPDPVPSNLEQ